LVRISIIYPDEMAVSIYPGKIYICLFLVSSARHFDGHVANVPTLGGPADPLCGAAPLPSSPGRHRLVGKQRRARVAMHQLPDALREIYSRRVLSWDERAD